MQLKATAAALATCLPFLQVNPLAALLFAPTQVC